MKSVRDMYCKFLAVEAILVIIIIITSVSDAASITMMSPLEMSFTQNITRKSTPILGCEFVNDAKGRCTFALGKLTETPIWGAPMEPYNITEDTGKEVYSNFFENLRILRTFVVKYIRFDHTEMFLRFFRDFKAQNTQDLASFYKGYRYSFDPTVAQPAYEIYLFDAMVKATGRPALFQHFFMISVYSEVPEDYLKTLENGEPRTFSHQHTAGALRITFYDKNRGKSRAGLVLVDLSLDLAEEKGGIVLMDDEMAPHYVTSTQHNGLKVKFEYANSERQYVVSSVYARDGLSIISKNLYYVGKPYCSFVDTTLKPMLLIPIHGMMTRYGNGFKDSFVNFLTLPLTELKTEKEHSFYIQYKTSSGEIQHKAIAFGAAENRNFEEGTFKMVENVCQGLCVKIDDFLDKMADISKLVMKNESLLSQIFELSKQYHLINSKTAYQTELVSKFPNTGKNDRIIILTTK
uniref:Uncharacterized protein n=1 Tax=Cacopsylla melanoneura TaxID=428564 RepID=A0A8D8YPC5_9HEMI